MTATEFESMSVTAHLSKSPRFPWIPASERADKGLVRNIEWFQRPFSVMVRRNPALPAFNSTTAPVSAAPSTAPHVVTDEQMTTVYNMLDTYQERGASFWCVYRAVEASALSVPVLRSALSRLIENKRVWRVMSHSRWRYVTARYAHYWTLTPSEGDMVLCVPWLLPNGAFNDVVFDSLCTGVLRILSIKASMPEPLLCEEMATLLWPGAIRVLLEEMERRRLLVSRFVRRGQRVLFSDPLAVPPDAGPEHVWPDATGRELVLERLWYPAPGAFSWSALPESVFARDE
jgi:hypothetical protein